MIRNWHDNSDLPGFETEPELPPFEQEPPTRDSASEQN